VFGDEYPEGLDPYSYVSVSELDRFVSESARRHRRRARRCRLRRGRVRGLWDRSGDGARPIGIDIAEAALAAARARAQAMGMQPQFRLGSFESTGQLCRAVRFWQICSRIELMNPTGEPAQTA
jgi:hypothetical protein